ncbi:MAG: DUF1501 domain-containing protein, partial [Planctomycetota bacterium]
EVAEIDYGGWDTHQNQGGTDGAYGNLIQGLGDALAAFMADLEQQLENVLIVTVSEFGRTAAQNGTNGTDHGWGNCMMVMGGSVPKARAQNNKPVLTTWPGLSLEQLYQQRDLLHTTDFRDVFGEIVKNHLGNPNLQTVLPNHSFNNVGVII